MMDTNDFRFWIQRERLVKIFTYSKKNDEEPERCPLCVAKERNKTPVKFTNSANITSSEMTLGSVKMNLDL